MYNLTLYETAEALGISFYIINISGGLDLFFFFYNFGGRENFKTLKIYCAGAIKTEKLNKTTLSCG